MSLWGQLRRLSNLGMSASPPTSDIGLRRCEPTLGATNGHVAYGSGVSKRIIDRFKIRPGGNTLAAMPANRSDRVLTIDLIVLRRF